ncbi:MAG: TIGR02147 family protein [Desulfatiglans sp.]|jgi:uncharacterized protein (TIGR02147 family)|nr:TIGR02147 family protein [Desulfatiglans sp.]
MAILCIPSIRVKDKHGCVKSFTIYYFSPNFLKLIIDGKRNLSNEGTGKVAKGFEFKKQEREYFENLVFMNQASSHDDKDYYYKKMMTVNGYLKSHKIDKAGYAYFSKWYYPVIDQKVCMLLPGL